LFSQSWLKSDGRHSSLEFGAKSGKKSSTIRRKNAKFDEEMKKKSEIQFFNREKMLTIFG